MVRHYIIHHYNRPQLLAGVRARPPGARLLRVDAREQVRGRAAHRDLGACVLLTIFTVQKGVIDTI